MRYLARPIAASLAATALVASVLLVPATAASAVATDGNAAPGRAEGSGNWGYVGQFGQVNTTTEATAGQFFLPYGIDVDGDTIAVTDSGRTSWESGSKVIGHTVQTFSLTAEPGSAGHGDYLGNGQFDVVNTKSTVADPADIVQPEGLHFFPTTDPRGPRGVSIAADGTIVAATYESSDGVPALFRFADSALATATPAGGDALRGTPGYGRNFVATDTDAERNTFVTTVDGVNVYDANGNLLSSISQYFDANGVNQAARITWSNRKETVPAVFADPDFLGETWGLSVVDDGDTLTVYVGETGSFYEADPAVHFQQGTTATGLNLASITKFTVEKSGGVMNDLRNPAAWKWARDTSFGVDGRVIIDPNATLRMLGAKPVFTNQTVFALEADPNGENLYYSANRDGLVTLDQNTGDIVDGPVTLNAPGTHDDSKQGHVRGIAVDERGLVYATTQHLTITSNKRAIVQIWGMTPTSIDGTATATPAMTSVDLAWGESTRGYQQTELLEYVVQYREAGAADWIIASAPTRLSLATTIDGLAAGTTYEAKITPWNEAGSGDPATVTFTTMAASPELSVVKKGNGEVATTADEAIEVTAGAEVTFTYDVTNTGDVPLTGVTVSDDMLGEIAPPDGFDGTLAVDETVTFTARGTVAEGAYRNVATAMSSEAEAAVAEWHGLGIVAPQPTETPVEPTAEPTAQPSATPTPELPATGADATAVATLTALALALLIAGAVIVGVRRRQVS